MKRFIASFAFVLRPPKRRPQRRRAKPIPLDVGVTSFACKRNFTVATATISRCHKATFHIPLAEYFTITERISLYE